MIMRKKWMLLHARYNTGHWTKAGLTPYHGSNINWIHSACWYNWWSFNWTHVICSCNCNPFVYQLWVDTIKIFFINKITSCGAQVNETWKVDWFNRKKEAAIIHWGTRVIMHKFVQSNAVDNEGSSHCKKIYIFFSKHGALLERIDLVFQKRYILIKFFEIS